MKNITIYYGPKKGFEKELPYNNITLTELISMKEYKKNLINSLYWTHHNCSIINSECFCYDIWAYSKIYYHLELYNKPYFDSFLEEYRKS